ncbi:prolyl 4-hydroxylase subunit alpha-1-like [Haemaphysalis longicornis]
MQEVLGSETLALEDASYLLLLEEARLQEAKERHRREVPTTSHTDHDDLGKFLSASRFGVFLKDVLALRQKSNGRSLRSAFKSPSSGDCHPLLVLQPLALEMLSSKPRIVVFSSFLSRSEVNFIRHNSVRALTRANYTPDAVSWLRISKVAWLSDTEHDVLQRISRRIAAATNLSLESAEPYQVANYGLGGHYTPHVDPVSFDSVADEICKNRGNRLATILLFLSDVRAGGATAFVELGLAVRPRAGDALFWLNIEPYEGSDSPWDFPFWHQKRAPDYRTEHVGCPVLRGSKWISTKWIREMGNVVVNYDFPG